MYLIANISSTGSEQTWLRKLHWAKEWCSQRQGVFAELKLHYQFQRASSDGDMVKANTNVYMGTRRHSWLYTVWQTVSVCLMLMSQITGFKMWGKKREKRLKAIILSISPHSVLTIKTHWSNQVDRYEFIIPTTLCLWGIIDLSRRPPTPPPLCISLSWYSQWIIDGWMFL